MATYDLTPQQWAALMGRLGNGYGSFDDLVAHVGPGYSYSQTYIVAGRNQGEINSNGFTAVANGGRGAAAEVQVIYRGGAGSPSSFRVTTTDPRIQQEIQGLGVQGNAQEAARLDTSMAALRNFQQPDMRMEEFGRILRLFQNAQDHGDTLIESHPSRTGAETRGGQQPGSRRPSETAPSGRQPAPRPNEGRDVILDSLGRALQGTAFRAPTRLDLEFSRGMESDTGIYLPAPRGNVEPNEGFFVGPSNSTGMMRYMEPGGGSSVFAGDRRLYTDYPITMRNQFSGRSDHPAGTLRIFGNLDRPDRYAVITDNPALRAALGRANVPVQPLTGESHEPQRRQPSR